MWSPFKSKSAGSGGSRGPVDRVQTLSSQGMSEQQIIQTLKNEGYSPNQVDSAMRDALRSSAGGMPPQPMTQTGAPPDPYGHPERQGSMEPPPGAGSARQPDIMNMDRRSNIDMPPEPNPSAVPDSLRMPAVPSSRDEFDIDNTMATGMDRGIDDDLDLPPPPGRGPPRFDEPNEIEPFRQNPRERRTEKHRELEEIAEGIADDKWNDFRTESSELRTEIKDLADRIVVLERSMRKLQEQKDSELEGIKQTIGTYKDSLTDVGEKMEGMEKALKDSLGPMMETLRSLSDTVTLLKKG